MILVDPTRTSEEATGWKPSGGCLNASWFLYITVSTASSHSGVHAAAELTGASSYIFSATCMVNIRSRRRCWRSELPEASRMGRGLRPQPQNPHAESRKGYEQGEVRPASSATDGAAESIRWAYCIFTSMEMGSTFSSSKNAPVPYRRSGLPHHPTRPVALPALLLLHPRSGDRSAVYVHRHVSSVFRTTYYLNVATTSSRSNSPSGVAFRKDDNASLSDFGPEGIAGGRR